MSFTSSDDGCEMQLDSAAFVSNSNPNILGNQDSDDAAYLPLPDKFDTCMPNGNRFHKVGICPTFSAFNFTGWSLEQEERLMEDGKVQPEKVMLVHCI